MMKTQKWILLSALLAGCTTMNEQRQAKYLRNHPETTDTFASAISDGKVHAGMLKQEVFASWGHPLQRIPSMSGLAEVWVYNRHYLHFYEGKLQRWTERW